MTFGACAKSQSRSEAGALDLAALAEDLGRDEV
jgi:hypothetical protein